MNLSTAHLFGSECALSKTEIKTEFVVVFNLRVQRICNIWKLSYVEKSFPTQTSSGIASVELLEVEFKFFIWILLGHTAKVMRHSK